MHRTATPAALVGVLAAAIAPASALGKTVELGQTRSALVAPSCPAKVAPKNCTIILTEVTALETLGDGVAYPTTVKADGELVAFTVGLSRLSSNRATARREIKGLDATYGGVPQASIAVLKQTNRKHRTYKVVAESPAVHLIPYLGQVVQFPLAKPLPLKKGEVIALSVPTWAPVLSINLPTRSFAYRQGRSSGCATASNTPLAQRPGQSASYKCDYPGTRVEYTATEITSPVATPNYVHASDRGR